MVTKKVSRRSALGHLGAIVAGLTDRAPLAALRRSLTPIPDDAVAGPPTPLLDRVGVNVRARELGQSTLGLVTGYGFRWVRTDISWRLVEPTVGHFDFGFLRSGLQAVRARGLRVLGILDYGHPVHTGMLAPRGPAQRKAFVRFAVEAQRELGSLIAAWEIWNEPNHPHFWPPQADVQEFRALLSDVVAAMWKQDARAVLVTGGLSTIDERFLAELIPVVESLGRNGSLGLGLHPYRDTPPETVAADLARVGLLRDDGRAATGAGVPVWLTEWGYCRGTYNIGATRQAQWAPRVPLVGAALDSPLTVLFELRDGGPQDTAAYTCGLVSAEDKPYPVSAAWTAVASTCRTITPLFRHVPKADDHWSLGSCDSTLVWPDRDTLGASAAAVGCDGQAPECDTSVWRVAPAREYWVGTGRDCR